MDRPTCQSCLYFERVKGKRKMLLTGVCHRNPPVPGHGLPQVADDDWCGQHDRWGQWLSERPVEPQPESVA